MKMCTYHPGLDTDVESGWLVYSPCRKKHAPQMPKSPFTRAWVTASRWKTMCADNNWSEAEASELWQLQWNYLNAAPRDEMPLWVDDSNDLCAIEMGFSDV